ncbi:MAG: hypothetical protein HY017_25055 [Betaproteobacteria bacterium]|nr:hypothetical protein [Betaproteobacteria bacterium]
MEHIPRWKGPPFARDMVRERALWEKRVELQAYSAEHFLNRATSEVV